MQRPKSGWQVDIKENRYVSGQRVMVFPVPFAVTRFADCGIVNGHEEEEFHDRLFTS